MTVQVGCCRNVDDEDLVLPRWAVVSEPSLGDPGKTCGECGRWLSLSSFHRKKTLADGLKRECKECMGRYQVLNKHVMERARVKYEMAHGRRPQLDVGAGSGERLAKYAETGAVEERPSERDAAARLKAFEMGINVYKERG